MHAEQGFLTGAGCVYRHGCSSFHGRRQASPQSWSSDGGWLGKHSRSSASPCSALRPPSSCTISRTSSTTMRRYTLLLFPSWKFVRWTLGPALCAFILALYKFCHGLQMHALLMGCFIGFSPLRPLKARPDCGISPIEEQLASFLKSWGKTHKGSTLSRCDQAHIGSLEQYCLCSDTSPFHVLQLEGVLPECSACARNPVEHVGLNRERLSQTLEQLRPRMSGLDKVPSRTPSATAPSPAAFATHLSGVRTALGIAYSMHTHFSLWCWVLGFMI